MTSCFPIPIVDIISDYAAIWKVSSWLRAIEDTIPYDSYGSMLNYSRRIREKRYALCANPLGKYELESLTGTTLNGEDLSQNPANWALNILEKDPSYRSNFYLTINPNPRAIALISDIDAAIADNDDYYVGLLINPNAIDILRKRAPNAFNNPKILANPSDQIPKLARFQLRGKMTERRLYWLSHNSAPWAIDILKKHFPFTMNGWCYWMVKSQHPWSCERVIENITKGVEISSSMHKFMNRNPGMINYLRKHPEIITLNIWSNPGIFEPTPRPGVYHALLELSW